MNEEKKRRYEQLHADTKQEIAELDEQIEEVLAKVKDRLAELQNDKKALRQIYDATCQYLGIPNDLEAEEDEA